jgi:hypothetical protein
MVFLLPHIGKVKIRNKSKTTKTRTQSNSLFHLNNAHTVFRRKKAEEPFFLPLLLLHLIIIVLLNIVIYCVPLLHQHERTTIKSQDLLNSCTPSEENIVLLY